MTSLAIAGGEISYSDQGEGDGVVLVHGFAASAQENWIKAGWIQMLTRARRRVVAIDLRGHGASSKFHEPSMYALPLLAGDVLAVVEHLQIKKPDLIGFSLGGILGALLVVPVMSSIRVVFTYLLSKVVNRDPFPNEAMPEIQTRGFFSQTYQTYADN